MLGLGGRKKQKSVGEVIWITKPDPPRGALWSLELFESELKETIILYLLEAVAEPNRTTAAKIISLNFAATFAWGWWAPSSNDEQ